jgi:hypothetical protein
MLAEISSAQYSEWMAFYRLEPYGEERADLRAGIIASTIANANRGKNQKVFKPSDFIARFDPPDEEAEAALMIEKVRAALGGK